MASNNPGNNNAVAGALTFPTGNQTSLQPAPVQPKQPKNLQSLLMFAIEATKLENVPSGPLLGQMDERRRKFLEEAMQDLTLDIQLLLKKAIQVLSDTDKIGKIKPGDRLPKDVESAFNDLFAYIDDIDVANNFCKIGGYQIFPVCYSSENDEVRASASTALGQVCENNLLCQEKAMECGLLSLLINMVQTEQGKALHKGLFAISCITRNFEEGSRMLIALGGCTTLVKLLSSSDPTAQTKAAFLVSYLCQTSAEAKGKFIKINIVGEIATAIRAGRNEATEHLLHILSSLVSDRNPTIIIQCWQPKSDLRNLLENHLKHPDLADDRFIEEKQYCMDIIDKAFVVCPVQNTALVSSKETADR